MPGTLTFKAAKDADSNLFNYGFFDESGIGNGPFYAVHVAVDLNGVAVSPARQDQLPPTLGPKVMASSLSTTIASDQPPINVNITNLPTIQEVSLTGETQIAIFALPELPIGTNTIGAVTQDGGPWTVTWAPNLTLGAAQNGIWTVGLSSGTNTIGNAGIIANGNQVSTANPLPVGKRSTESFFVPAITAGTAYATLNVQVGQLLVFTNVVDTQSSGLIQSARIISDDLLTGVSFDLFLFNEEPINSTFTDNVAPMLAASDKAGLLGVLHFTTGISVFGAATLYQLDNIGKLFVVPTNNQILYGVLILTAGSPTFSLNTSLTVLLDIKKD
jgi:hypothetical protein